MRRRMTFAEFLERLPKDGWDIRDYGRIRRWDDDSTCPFLYVAAQRGVGSVQNFDRTNTLARQHVFFAADNYPGHNPAIRQRLLEACGLLEAA